MPDWLDPSSTVASVIAEAARLRGERNVVEGKDPQRLNDYYSAFNRAMQAVGGARTWWFLNRESAFATKDGQRTYAMRSQASSTITITAAPTAAQAVTVDGTAYAFTSTGAASASAAISQIIDLINAGTQAYAIQTSSTTVEMYWSGDDGNSKVVTDNATGVTTENFTKSMPDFSKLMGLRRPGLTRMLVRANPMDAFQAGRVLDSDGEPFAYAATEGEATLRIYSAQAGAPDDVYPIQVRYQAMPSAVLPNGQGRLDFPTQFHDLFPRMIQLILGMDVYDESAALGDQIVQRRLAEIESFTPDETPDDESLSYPNGIPRWLNNPYYCP